MEKSRAAAGSANGSEAAQNGARAAENVIDGLPPGPRLPRALQTAIWATRPVTMQRYGRRHYGDVFTLRPYGFGNMVVLGDPAMLKDVFTGDPNVFDAGAANEAMSFILGAQSPIVLGGEHHMRQRKLLLPPFHGKAVGRYRERVAEMAEAKVKTWPASTGPIRPRMEDITFGAILKALIGVRNPGRLERLGTELHNILKFGIADMWAVWLFPKVLDTPIGRRHPSQRARREIHRLLVEEIADHKAEPEGRDDVLASLVEVRYEDGSLLDDDEIVDIIITLVIAGHDTTTTGLAWACERLVRHPDKLERLVAEVDAGKSEYLEAVVNETMRVRPIVYAVWRKLKVPAVVAGHRLPAGTIVVAAIPLVQTSSVFPNADDFLPERWLEGSKAPYSMIPFGGGTRRCLGAAFADMEMNVILGAVLRNIELSAPDERPLKPEQPRVQNVTLQPHRGGYITIAPRVKPATSAPARDAEEVVGA